MNYELLLRERDMKVTPQRLGILTLMHDYGHISVEDLYTKIQKQFTSISLATLYKNVNAMLDASLLKEVKVPNMKPKYEIIKAPHAHLLCQSCGSLEDFEMDMNKITTLLTPTSDFQVNETDLIFSGLCNHCQK
ncbi:MAG: Fur family transcriptional regulator [Campylobacterota bacterium]|nr:Fur family transcriptional regulator [Campylobacterota bacterium]